LNETQQELPLQNQLDFLHNELSKLIVGRQKEIKLLLTALLSKGHVLLEDLPGMGKTTLVKAFAKVLDCSFSRIQCTPDLLPSDVIGTSVFHPKTSEFTFRKGPVFTQVLLVDEINRALPRTQSSLLESMEERQVSAEGQTFELPRPFMVLATQNPIEMEGTFLLPEAQLDRFLFKLKMDYPSVEEEEEMLAKVGDSLPYDKLSPVLHPAAIVRLQQECETVYVHSAIREYIVALAGATRQHPYVSVGVSPRASKAVYQAVKAWALLDGRDYVLPDDVKDLLFYVWNHRLILNAEARINGMGRGAVLEEVLMKVKLPEEAVGRVHERS
jgi:MoxR-like ATPase